MEFINLSNAEWIDVGLSVLVIVLTAILARPILNLLLTRVLRRLIGATKTTLDDKLLEAVRPSLYWLLLLVAFQFSFERLDFIKPDNFSMEDVYYILYFSLMFTLAMRMTTAFISWYSDEVAPKTESNLDEQLLPFFRRVIVIIMVVIAGIIFLGHFNIEASGLVASLGVGSLAIALAAQAALSDTISGFMIMLDRPFRIGDRIEIQDLDTWGDVVDIGLRSTHVRTRDNRTVIVPNSVIAKSLIVNHAYPDSQYRIQIEIGIAYGTEIELARKTIVDAVRGAEGVAQDKKVEALFLAFADSSLTFRVRWWIDNYADTRRMFDKVNTAMYNALNEAGIEIPFPQQDIHFRVDKNDARQLSEAFGRG